MPVQEKTRRKHAWTGCSLALLGLLGLGSAAWRCVWVAAVGPSILPPLPSSMPHLPLPLAAGPPQHHALMHSTHPYPRSHTTHTGTSSSFPSSTSFHCVMAQEQFHPIFRDMVLCNLEAVQQRVLADAAVLEQRYILDRMTPFMAAIDCGEPTIALWILEHRGQHDVNTADDGGRTALHWASDKGVLELLQALVAAGANPAARDERGYTPLILVSMDGRTDIVAFLLQLPAVKASIDHISRDGFTALSYASTNGRQPIVQLLLDAGADPTIPPGPRSPLNQAICNNRHAIAALLRHPIAEADRVRALHKARSLLGVGAAALACLQGRVEQEQALPWVELNTPHQEQQHETLRATAAFAVEVSGGEKESGLCEELYVELQEYMLPRAWADDGPEA